MHSSMRKYDGIYDFEIQSFLIEIQDGRHHAAYHQNIHNFSEYWC